MSDDPITKTITQHPRETNGLTGPEAEIYRREVNKFRCAICTRRIESVDEVVIGCKEKLDRLAAWANGPCVEFRDDD